MDSASDASEAAGQNDPSNLFGEDRAKAGALELERRVEEPEVDREHEAIQDAWAR
jgi:hypothetical protein